MSELPPLIPEHEDDLSTPESPLSPEEWAMDSLLAVSCRSSDAQAEACVGEVMRRISELEAARRRRRWVGLMTAATVALAVGGAALIYRTHLRTERELVDAHPTPAPAATAPGSTRIVLAVAETRVVPLGDNGRMLVQGPADVELLGISRARLHRGRIRVRIETEQGRGFVVETPRAQVTDLGTEFGVDVAGDDAAGDGSTGVVVFEGSVDLTVPVSGDASRVFTERLVQGEGLMVRSTGRLERFMSIITSDGDTYQRPGEPRSNGVTPLITDVWDNLDLSESKKLYQIVPGGLREDALAYVDRPEHEWNGVTTGGLPEYLLGADYVKTFCDDKRWKMLKVSLILTRPARLFVFLDRRVEPPDWLRRDFRNTGDEIGLDEGCWKFMLEGVGWRRTKTERASGPGESIDNRFSVWERTVLQPGTITLGSNAASSRAAGMYGIAAVPLSTQPAP